MDSQSLYTYYERIIVLGNELYNNLNSISNQVVGVNKLKRKIRQEIIALEKAKNAGTLRKEQLSCSNLHHFQAFVNCILADKNCVSILHTFTVEDKIRRKISVDIVTDERHRWRKVIARNPRALSQISVGDGEYQQKSIVDHAHEFITCARQNLVFFVPPVVEFHFACGIESVLADTLTSIGVVVSGHILGCDRSISIHQSSLTNVIQKVNLDVTAMIAYISALTNGHAHKKIKGEILNQHAQWERERPVKSVLDHFFEGKELHACKKAMSDFRSIVSTIGGPSEQMRAEELCARVSVVEDRRLQGVQLSGQLKERGLVVFGTGQALRAVTVTANTAFLRAAATQGIHLDAFVHEPRSLTEQKEIL